MALYRENGTPYKLSGQYVQYNPCGPQNKLFSRWDEEIIRIGGSPILYYEVLIQFNTLDQLFLEDRGKLYSPCPIQLYAYYEPPDQLATSGIFGVDTPDMEVIFETNYDATERAIGHKPKIGSRIFSSHLCENWVIVDVRSAEYRGWGRLRMQLHCRKFQPNRTDGSDQMFKNPDNFPTF